MERHIEKDIKSKLTETIKLGLNQIVICMTTATKKMFYLVKRPTGGLGKVFFVIFLSFFFVPYRTRFDKHLAEPWEAKAVHEVSNTRIVCVWQYNSITKSTNPPVEFYPIHPDYSVQIVTEVCFSISLEMVILLIHRLRGFTFTCMSDLRRMRVISIHHPFAWLNAAHLSLLCSAGKPWKTLRSQL